VLVPDAQCGCDDDDVDGNDDKEPCDKPPVRFLEPVAVSLYLALLLTVGLHSLCV
jgi:hypothetical protein